MAVTKAIRLGWLELNEFWQWIIISSTIKEVEGHFGLVRQSLRLFEYANRDRASLQERSSNSPREYITFLSWLRNLNPCTGQMMAILLWTGLLRNWCTLIDFRGRLSEIEGGNKLGKDIDAERGPRAEDGDGGVAVIRREPNVNDVCDHFWHSDSNATSRNTNIP